VSDLDLDEEELSPFFPFPFEEDEPWQNIYTLKKRSVYKFIKQVDYLTTTSSNLLIKSHQHQNLFW
jgi:hypothetical protein